MAGHHIGSAVLLLFSLHQKLNDRSDSATVIAAAVFVVLVVRRLMVSLICLPVYTLERSPERQLI